MEEKQRLPGYLRVILIVVGFISLGIGILGIFLPLLPTTPLIVLSAGCFANSSEKFYNWLVTNKTFGEYIQNYREGKGICLKHKLVAVATVWVGISASVVVVPICWARASLFLIATGVTVYLRTLPTLEAGC